MCTIGILPSLVNHPNMLDRLARETGLIKASGKHTHLVAPGQSVKAPSKKCANFTPSPFNGGGHAA